MLIVRHTDETREFAYDRKSSIGRLDKALDEANANGSTVEDMKKDWKAHLTVPFMSLAEAGGAYAQIGTTIVALARAAGRRNDPHRLYRAVDSTAGAKNGRSARRQAG